MTLGPVEYVLIGFPGNRFKGEIIPALAQLVEAGTIRIIDIVFVKKDADGAMEVIEYEALDEVTDVAEIEARPVACSATRTSHSPRRRSNPAARRPSSYGRTNGRRRWPTHCATPAAC